MSVRGGAIICRLRDIWGRIRNDRSGQGIGFFLRLRTCTGIFERGPGNSELTLRREIFAGNLMVFTGQYIG